MILPNHFQPIFFFRLHQRALPLNCRILIALTGVAKPSKLGRSPYPLPSSDTESQIARPSAANFLHTTSAAAPFLLLWLPLQKFPTSCRPSIHGTKRRFPLRLQLLTLNVLPVGVIPSTELHIKTYEFDLLTHAVFQERSTTTTSRERNSETPINKYLIPSILGLDIFLDLVFWFTDKQ